MMWKWKGCALFMLIVALAGHCVSTAWGADDRETWIKTFEGLDYGAFFDVVLTDDGTLLAVGTTCAPLGSTTRGDVLVAKLTLAGELIWEKTHGGDATDQAFCVEATGDGGFLVLAETDSFGAGERDLYVLKLDASGDLMWSETYGGAESNGRRTFSRSRTAGSSWSGKPTRSARASMPTSSTSTRTAPSCG